MPGNEGSSFEAEAAKTLAAAERALARAQQLQAAIQRGETTAAEVESRVRRGVARDRVAGETIGERKAAPAETAAQDEQAIRNRTNALKQETQVQAGLNRTRDQGAAINRLAFQKQYGPYAETRNLEQQKGLLEDINRSRQRAYYGAGLPGNRAPYLSMTPIGAADAQRYYGAPGGPELPGGGRGVVPPPGGFPALGAGGTGPSRVGSSFAADAAMTQQAKVAVAGYRSELSRLIQVQGGASNAMRRHGALTTEFISAAARGETTIRELGFQTAATIGKFGGWLGAGALIYGVAGAMSELGRGALDAYSGVNQVQRVIRHGVDASALRGSFRDLAGEFNLPIGTVTDAVYQMGKVFHNTDDALAASRSVLYSVKVGELDVADATRYLIAIVNGFQLPASQLTTVFDQINQAQNRFGITIADVEAGLAKASGQFRQSGGDVTHLIALITTAQKVTGNTGQVVGTAISRAPNFLRQASNQQALREFGIKASTNVQDVITQAFRISNKLSGARLQDLSHAIFGPQYGARVGTALLANRDLYQQVLKTVQPDRAAGSAQRELQTALGGVNEQLQKILITIQRIGSNLAEAGGFDLLFVLVKTLNAGLTAANGLLETFNKLPAPLRHTLSILTELALLVRLLQRLQLGESIRGGESANPGGVRGAFGAVFSEGERGGARRYRAGLYEEQKFYEAQRTAVTGKLAQAGFQGDVASEQYLAAQQRIEQLAREGADGTDRMKDALVTQEAAERQMVAARQSVLSLEGQNLVATQRLNEVNQSLASTRKRFGLPGLNVKGAVEEARRVGAAQFIPSLFEKPTTAEPQRAVEAVGRQADGLAKTSAGLVLPPAVAAQVDKTEANANRAAQSSGRTAGRLRSMTGTFNRLLGSFGNLLFAAFAVSIVLDQLNGLVDALDKEFASTAVNADSFAQQAGQLHTVTQQAGGGNTIQDYASDFFTGSGIFRNFPILPGGAGGPGIGDQRRQIAADEQQRIADQLALQNRARAEGKPIPLRYATDIQRNIEDLKTRNLTREQTNKALDKYDQELAQSQGSTKDQKSAIEALKRARADSATNKDLANRIRTLQEDDLAKGLDASLSFAGFAQGKAQTAAFTRARTYYERIHTNLSASHNADDIASLAQERQKFYDGVQQVVQDELTRSLLLAKSPGARLNAYSQAYSTLRQQLVNAPRSDLKDQEAKVHQLRQQANAAQAAQAKTLGDLGGGLGGIAGALGVGGLKLPDSRQAQRLTTKLKAEQDNAKAARKFLQESEREYRQMKAEIQQQQYEEQAAVRQAHTDIRVARTADPIRQAQIQIDFLGREIERAIGQYGKGSQQVLQLIQQREAAITQRAQAQVGLIQSRGQLAEAGINQQTDPVGYAQQQIADLNKQLAFEQAHPNQFDPATIISLEAQIRSAEVQLGATVYAQATALRDAAFDIAVARAQYHGNDVAAAKRELSKAQYDLSRAQTPQERRQAQAQVLQQRAAVEQAIFASRLGTIQYEADIDKITTGQEISQLRNLLHLAHITRDQRRQIKEQIFQLRQQESQDASGFDLQLGNIKLPTIYEIRRAMQGGIDQSSKVNVQQTNKVTINVKNAHDAATVGKALDKVVNGGAANAMRSAGLA